MTFNDYANQLFEKYLDCNVHANELKKGDKVANINPECQHAQTKGVVTKVKANKGKGGVSGKTVFYKVTDDKKHKGKYKGKEIEKTEIQLRKEATLKPTPHIHPDATELEMGIKVEMEHTNDRKTAKTIALQHLKEDPKYYTKLKKVHID